MKGLIKRISTAVLVLMMVCAFMPICSDSAFAAYFPKTEMSNPTYYASGCLKTLDVTIQASGYYAEAYGKIGIHTSTSPYNWDNMYTTDGSKWPGTIADPTLLGLSTEEFLWTDCEEHCVTVVFEDGKIPCNQDNDYTVHLWTRAAAYGVYTDATFDKLKTSSTGQLSFGNKMILSETPPPAEPEEPEAPTGLSAEKPSVIDGTDGKITGVDETMEYSLDGGQTWIPVKGTEIGDLSAGEVLIRVKETETAKAGKTASVTVPAGTEKAEGPQSPSGASGEKPSVIDGTDGKITGVDETMEYSLDGGQTWIPVKGTEIGGLSAGEVLIRVKETEKVKAGKAASVTVPEGTEKAEGPDAPEGLAAEKPSVLAGSDGKITGVDETMEYSLDGGETWIPVTGSEITGLSAGDIVIRVKETEKVKAGEAVTVNVPPQTTVWKKDRIALNEGLKVITGKNVVIKWGDVYYADEYGIYMEYCGGPAPALVKTVKNGNMSATIKKLHGKSINQKKNIKCYVVAYKWVDGKKVKIAKTYQAHGVGKKNTKNTDAKKVLLAKTSFSLKVNDSVKIKAKTVKVKSRLPILTSEHSPEFRYVTSNDKIASVSENGRIKAKSEGSCNVYVFAINGMARVIKVNVQ